MLLRSAAPLAMAEQGAAAHHQKFGVVVITSVPVFVMM